MTRHLWVFIHRYVGLAMTFFLILVGLTGSVLAFYSELDRWLNPELLTVPVRDAPMIDPFALRDRAEALEPRARVDQIPLATKPDESFGVWLAPKTDPATGKDYELPYSDLYLNPYTGEKLGARKFGEVSLAKENILSFLYRLHYSLALPETTGNLGGYILGITALVWTLDCFVGFYLTLPVMRTRSRVPAEWSRMRSWWQRWKPAWLIKRSRFNYDLHRASGLWVWPMLFVLAWSSVAFNLTEVYQPVMKLVFDMRSPDDLPKLDKPLEIPALGWREAYAQGQRLMMEAGARYGFTVLTEQSLFLDREHGVYHYLVRGSEDLGKSGGTRVLFDANTGALKALITPNTEANGQVITDWLVWLHMAQVFGLSMQIFVCIMGLVITVLSVTGVIIWWRKRRTARHQRERRTQTAPA